MELLESPVRIRSGTDNDVDRLLAVVSDPEVTRWWPAGSHDVMIRTLLGGEADAVGFVIEVDREIAGFIQYYEELDPQYRHAGIDIVLGDGFRNRGAGTTAVRMLARYLFEERGHHRIIIDPNAQNRRAIRSYEKVGFRPVGIMRAYEWDREEGRWTDGLLMDMLREDLRD